MGLCHLCSGIPFDNPPSLPPPYKKNLPGRPLHPASSNLFFLDSIDPNYDLPPYGYSHWKTKGNLESSSRTCSLCKLIYDEFVKNTPNTAPQPVGDHNFFITSREKNQSGFIVWTQGNKPRVIWRVGAFGYSVEDGVWVFCVFELTGSLTEPLPLFDEQVGSPLAHDFKGRKICERSGDPEAQKISRKWLDHCVRYHTLCGPPGGTLPRLPTRVLDLGPSGTSQVKLWETKGARGNYTTLSYTWGPGSLGHTYKTTPANIGRYENEIDLVGDDMPQTIIDAIQITRNMGIQYLWVDALCIRQDADYKDFNVEGLKMMDYYGNSYLTITAASSSDAYSGVFNARNPPDHVSIPYTSKSGVDGTLIVTALHPEKENIQPMYLSFAGNPIVTRAWTLQERILSTRNIFYAHDQMYFECNEHFVSEDGLLVHGRQLSTNPDTQELSLFEDRPSTDLWDRWDLLVQLYAGREMRDPDRNKFVAVAGLAKRFGQVLGGGRYHAGLWTDRIIQQLFWSVSNIEEDVEKTMWCRDWPPPPEHYRAPSWSWAAMDMAVLNPDGRIYDAEIYATHENLTITLMQDDDYGQIGYADLIIKAPLLRISYLGRYEQYGMEAHDWGMDDGPAGAKKMISVRFSTSFDYEFRHSELQSLNVYALVLGRDTIFSQDGINNVNYLCIIVAKMESARYRRMGIVWLDESSMGDRAIRYMDKSSYEEIVFV